jgi:hypothetical protein
MSKAYYSFGWRFIFTYLWRDWVFSPLHYFVLCLTTEFRSGLEIRNYGRRNLSRWPRGTLYTHKLALTLPTCGRRLVGIYNSLTDSGHGEFSFFFVKNLGEVRHQQHVSTETMWSECIAWNTRYVVLRFKEVTESEATAVAVMFVDDRCNLSCPL